MIMRVTIVTFGSHGDVRPYVALSLGLKRSGHEVRLASWGSEQEFVSSFGVEFVSMEWNEPTTIPEWISIFGLLTNTINSTIYSYHNIKNGLLDELWRVCQGAEAIIFNGTSFPCYYIAEKLGIPCYAAPMQTYHQTRAFPSAAMTDGKPLGSIYNWLSHPFFNQFFWQSVRQTINQWRKETLNLPPLPFWKGVVHQMQEQKIPFLYGYSPYFLPKPSEWTDDFIHITGYWYLDTSETWQPPNNLMNFLSAGPAPIYISQIWHRERLGKEMVLKLLALTGQRIIVQGLDDDLCDIELTDKLFYIKGLIPHEWLFPKMALVIHHGGLGTTMSSLRAGVPVIAIPIHLLTDQAFWVLQLANLGLGIPLILQRNEQLSAERLAEAIKIAINDNAMQDRVAEISKKIQDENGVQRAVEAFNQHLPSNQHQNPVKF